MRHAEAGSSRSPDEREHPDAPALRACIWRWWDCAAARASFDSSRLNLGPRAGAAGARKSDVEKPWPQCATRLRPCHLPLPCGVGEVFSTSVI